MLQHDRYPATGVSVGNWQYDSVLWVITDTLTENG